MDLKKEKKIKFWLWGATKVLLIGYFVLRTGFFVSEKMGLIEDQKNIENIKNKTAKLEIEDNVFSWKEINRKAILRIKNFSSTEGQNVTIRAYAHYGNMVDLIKFNKAAFVSPNGFVTVESDLEGIPLGQRPDSISVCLSHESENTKTKTSYKFRLKGSIIGLSRPYFGQVTYKVKLIDKEYFDDEAPPCFEKTSDIDYTNEIVRARRIDSLEQLKQLKIHAQVFLTGLNFRKLSEVREYVSQDLFEHLNSKDKNFEYGFNTEATVLSNNGEIAYVQLLLTQDGWSKYIAKDFYYQMQNSSRKSETFFDFLEFNDNTWIGKLKKEGGVWRFYIHEKSALGTK